MTFGKDIVVATMPGKMISNYTYLKNYVYSLGTQKLLVPDKIEKSTNGKYWKDLYFLSPGKYLIIEVDIDIENNCTYKCMTVLSKEDYLSIKRKQFLNIGNFEKLYQSCGLEITDWGKDIPNWVKLPSECIPEIKEEYKQPQEVEDALSPLLKEDEIKKSTISFLSERYEHKKSKRTP